MCPRRDQTGNSGAPFPCHQGPGGRDRSSSTPLPFWSCLAKTFRRVRTYYRYPAVGGSKRRGTLPVGPGRSGREGVKCGYAEYEVRIDADPEAGAASDARPTLLTSSITQIQNGNANALPTEYTQLSKSDAIKPPKSTAS